MPRATQDTGRLRTASRTGLSPSAAALSSALPPAILLAISRSYNPREAVTSRVWANPRSLATTWGITFCFLFLQVLRCFSSLRSPPPAIQAGDRTPCGRVAPFGHPGVKGRLRLTPDFRSLPRPSSPRGAKASTYAPLSAYAACPQIRGHRIPKDYASCVALALHNSFLRCADNVRM